MMRRATIFYIAMILALIGGLWVMVRIGSQMQPPRDVSGAWKIETSDDQAAAGSILRIQQSGKYFHLTFDDGSHLDLMVRAEREQFADGSSTLNLTNGSDAATLVVSAAKDHLAGNVHGKIEKSFSARWVGKESAIKPGSQQLAAAEHSWLHRWLESPIGLLIAQVLVVLALSRAMGIVFAKLHQPQVVGEMIAGIMLGPSLFGWLLPVASAALFPQGGLANLNTLSQVGVIFFLFLIGLELDPKLLRNRGHAAVVISHISIVAPFLLGAGLTLYLYKSVFNHEMRYLSVALFMGAAMSITAFPVLARILTERNLHKTPVGAVSITCAAVDDVTAWCILAFVVGIARATGLKPGLITAAEACIYVGVMFLVIRPFLRRLQVVHERQGRLSQNVVATIVLLTLLSAYTTEIIGIHALFGAFLMGAIMPKGTQFVRTLSEKLEDFTVVFLLPLFFAFTGLKTQIGLLNSASLWLDTGLIVLVACMGKFGGSSLAARVCGMGWRESSVIGILMNTRGLMELVILNIGQDLGVITPAVFAMMVIMALVTTAMTTPVLQLIGSRKLFEQRVLPGAGPKPSASTFSVLIPVADPKSGAQLFRIARNLAGPPSGGGRIMALHLRRPVDREAYRSGLADLEDAATGDPLRVLLEDAQRDNITVEPFTRVGIDVPAGIAGVAGDERADLVLMGFHKSVVSRTFLGGVVHRVLGNVQTDVAIFVDHGFRSAREVLVPYLGGKHDVLAMQLAERLARLAGARITILHVVDPMRPPGAPTLEVRDVVERVYREPSSSTVVNIRVVEDVSPVDAVLQIAAQFDLVLLGISEQWGLESHLFGWRPERIATGSPASLLIVRKHGG
jgi:Kef-type K+ transport system membrane component KefB